MQTVTSLKPTESNPLDAKERYFSAVASRYRDCKKTEDCVLWNNPVNVNGIGPLHNCYVYWKDISDASQVPLVMNLPGRRHPIRPNYAVCQKGQCVAMFGPSLRNWRLDYRKAMMDAMDPAVPNAPDPECVKNIPKAHLQESERRRRQLRAY